MGTFQRCIFLHSQFSKFADSRKGYLHSGVSYAALTLALTVAGGALGPAHAATYTASDQASLIIAVNKANADGDPTSKIVLTGSFSIAGNALPAVTKTLTIDTGGFTLSATGNGTLNSTAGATLTIDGVTSGTGTLGKDGAGTVVLTGNGTYSSTLTVNAGTVRVENGAQMKNGSLALGTFAVATGGSSNANLVVSGAGTLLYGGASGNHRQRRRLPGCRHH